MRAKVTDEGVLIPRELLEAVDEVDIHREGESVVVVPVGAYDPVIELGEHPVTDAMKDASGHHDRYLYGL